MGIKINVASVVGPFKSGLWVEPFKKITGQRAEQQPEKPGGDQGGDQKLVGQLYRYIAAVGFGLWRADQMGGNKKGETGNARQMFAAQRDQSQP